MADLKKDWMVMLQHQYMHWIGAFVAFVLPAIDRLCVGRLALGARRVSHRRRGPRGLPPALHLLHQFALPLHRQAALFLALQARDSWIMAVVTFGEGYHNYHHEFQHDYRNGVKPWQFDPTKWIIWTLSKVGLAKNLRRVPADTILRAELAASRDRTNAGILGRRSASYGDRKCKGQIPVTVIIAIKQSHTKMISTLISLLIAGLVLYVIYYVVGMFIKGQLLSIIGIVLGLLFLLYALSSVQHRGNLAYGSAK